MMQVILWSNIDQAYDAGNAFLKQVFIDTGLGYFDTSSELIFGYDSEVICEVYTVFTNLSETQVVPRRNDTSVRGMRQHTVFQLFAVKTREHGDLVFAKWSKSVKVPEPSTCAIFALGMLGLASRRFKKQS